MTQCAFARLTLRAANNLMAAALSSISIEESHRRHQYVNCMQHRSSASDLLAHRPIDSKLLGIIAAEGKSPHIE